MTKAELRHAFEGERVAQTRAQQGRGVLERELGASHAGGVAVGWGGVPDTCPRAVAGHFDERDVGAVEAFVTELAIEDGVQFFAEEQLESQCTKACAWIRAPRPAVAFVAHG